MKTNRDRILEECLRVFLSMNYERASISRLSEACGLSRMGIHHYYPDKLSIFRAVADRYIFEAQAPESKFDTAEGSLADFIDRYLEGIRRTMAQLVVRCDTGEERGGSPSLPTSATSTCSSRRGYTTPAPRRSSAGCSTARVHCGSTPWSGPPAAASWPRGATCAARLTRSTRSTSDSRSRRGSSRGSTWRRYAGNTTIYTN